MTELIGDLARDEYEERLRDLDLKHRRDPYETITTHRFGRRKRQTR